MVGKRTSGCRQASTPSCHDLNDVQSAVQRDVVILDWSEGVGAVHSFFRRVGWVGANSLAEAAELVGVGGVPNVFIFRVPSELSML